MRFLKPQRILHAITTNFSAKVIGGILGVVQVILIAREFGISPSTDAYMIALWIPMFFWDMGESILTYSLVPHLVAVQEQKGKEEERKIVGALFFWFVLILSGIAVVIGLVSPVLPSVVAPGFPSETQAQTADLLRWLAPVIFLGGLGAFASCLFYASHRFAVPAALSLIPDILMIGFLVGMADRWGILAPVFGFLLGVGVQTFLLYGVLLFMKEAPRFRYASIREFLTVARLMGPRFGGAAINRFNIGADRFFASMISAGAVSSLSFAYRLVQVPIMLAVAAFGKTLMPTLTREIVRNGPESLRGIIPKCIGFVAFGLVPLVLFFAFFSEPIIRILYQRGAFDAEATRQAAEIFFYYSFGILLNASCIVLQGAFYALRDTLTPLKVNLAALVLNIILDILLMNWMGLAGIALASVLVAGSSFVYLLVIMKRKIGGWESAEMNRSLRRIIPVTAILGGLVWGISSWCSPYMASETLRIQVLLIVTIFVLSWGAYLILCRWLRVEELLVITRFLKRGSHG